MKQANVRNYGNYSSDNYGEHTLVFTTAEGEIDMIKNKLIFENDKIEVYETGRDYDFVACIVNKTDRDITLRMDDDAADENAILNPIKIPANDWIGLINWEYEGNTAQALAQGDYTIYAS